MKRMMMPSSAGVLAVALMLSTTPAAAAPLLLNGGFESGFAGWSRANQLGSEGTFALQTGTLSPVNFITVPAPPGAVTVGMTDALGPGSHILYQDFVVPIGTTSGTLTFDLFVGNRAAAFFTPTTLDFSGAALNQQARVDIIRASADPFSVSAADVLFNAFQTTAGGPLVTDYTTLTADLATVLAANVGSTLRLRFAEVDNVNSFQLGVDNVNLDASSATVPEPSTVALLGLGVVGAVARRRRAI